MSESTLTRKLLSGGAWAFFGKLIAGFSGLLISVLLAHLLSPEELAAYFLTFSLVTFSTILMQLGLAQSIVRFIAESLAKKEFARAKSAIKKSLLLSLLSFVLIGFVLLSGGWSWIANHLAHSTIVESVAIVGIFWVFPLLFQSLIAEIFRGFHNIKFASVFGGLITVVSSLFAFSCLFFFSGHASLDQIIFLSALASSSSLLISFPFLIKELSKLSNHGQVITWNEILSVSTPLWGTYLFLFILSQVDIWILAMFRPQDEVAIYGAVTRLVLLLAISLTIVNAVVPPVMAKLFAQGLTKQLEKILRIVATVSGAPLIIGIFILIPFGGGLLKMFFGEHYEAGALAFSLLCVAQIVNVWTGSPGQLLVQSRRHRELFVISVVSGVVVLGLTLILVGRLGYNGVAIGTMVGVITHNVIMWFVCKRLVGIDTSMYPPWYFRKLYWLLRGRMDEKAINTSIRFIKLIVSALRVFDEFLWRMKKIEVIECYGDSHLVPISRLNARFLNARFVVNSVRGATAMGITNPNLKTNAMQIFDRLLSKAQKRRSLLFCLGEVDCGFLIWLQANKYQTSELELLDKAINSYTSFILKYKREGQRVFVLSAPLPTINDNTPQGEIASMRKEIEVSQYERTKLTQRFNSRMRQWCDSNQILFVGMDELAIDQATNLVLSELLNSNPLDHHYDPDAFVNLLEKLLSKWFI